jgi:hypothetical protein
VASFVALIRYGYLFWPKTAYDELDGQTVVLEKRQGVSGLDVFGLRLAIPVYRCPARRHSH